MAKETTAPKYGVENLAKDLGILPASVRVQLRNKKVKKNSDGVYGWNSQADYKKVVSLFDAAEKKPAAKKAKVKGRKAKAAPVKEAA